LPDLLPQAIGLVQAFLQAGRHERAEGHPVHPDAVRRERHGKAARGLVERRALIE
jgi:hypothetical protein